VKRDAASAEGRDGPRLDRRSAALLAGSLASIACLVPTGQAAAAIAKGGFGVSAVVLPACVVSVSPPRDGAAPGASGVVARCTTETPHQLTMQATGEAGRGRPVGGSADDVLARPPGERDRTPHILSGGDTHIVVTIVY
jgi:hypothetical protein